MIVLVPGQDRLGPFVPATSEMRARLYGSRTKDYSKQSSLQIVMTPLNAMRSGIFEAALKVSTLLLWPNELVLASQKANREGWSIKEGVPHFIITDR